MMSVSPLSSAVETIRPAPARVETQVQAAAQPTVSAPAADDDTDPADEAFDFSAAKQAAAARLALDQYQADLASRADKPSGGSVSLGQAEAAYREFG